MVICLWNLLYIGESEKDEGILLHDLPDCTDRSIILFLGVYLSAVHH